MAKKNVKQIQGFVSGAWCADDYEYPTHTFVTLNPEQIKAILKKMDQVKKDKSITAVSCNLGFCDYFRIAEQNLTKFAAITGLNPDDLSNVDTSKYLPVFTEIADVTALDLVEEYRTGGHVDTEIHESYVVWKAHEKYNGALMESPCIDRPVLEKWLKGVFNGN